MRLSCPYCGERDLREFTYRGAAVALDRPAPDAGADAWDGYVHLRDNPAGDTRDLWYHDPCGAWIEIHRNTVTHAVHGARAVREGAAPAAGLPTLQALRALGFGPAPGGGLNDLELRLPAGSLTAMRTIDRSFAEVVTVAGVLNDGGRIENVAIELPVVVTDADEARAALVRRLRGWVPPEWSRPAPEGAA